MAKYRLPWTSDHAQDQTLADLLVEYYEDFFEKHPSEARKALFDSEGEYTFDAGQLDGDPLIEKWEREIAQGLTPDLEEGLPQDERQRLAADRAKALQKQAGEPRPTATGKYATKRAAIGSDEERRLLSDSRINKQLMGAGPGEKIDLMKDLLGRG